MSRWSEDAFRALLGPGNVLRPDALAAPPRAHGFTVFAQRTDAQLDIAQLKSHAARFFDAKVGLTVDKHYGAQPPSVDAANVVLQTTDPASSGTRLCFGRPADADDHAAADAAERTQGTFGLALLARRCQVVWTVERVSEEDRVALAIAAIFASVLLGPILVPSGDALLGVRSARTWLDSPPRAD